MTAQFAAEIEQEIAAIRETMEEIAQGTAAIQKKCKATVERIETVVAKISKDAPEQAALLQPFLDQMRSSLRQALGQMQ